MTKFVIPLPKEKERWRKPFRFRGTSGFLPQSGKHWMVGRAHDSKIMPYNAVCVVCGRVYRNRPDAMLMVCSTTCSEMHRHKKA